MPLSPRLSWDEYFVSIVKLIAKRSVCTRRQVGAIIVKNTKILSTGYNGPIRKAAHPDKVGCLRDRLNIASGTRQEVCRGLHAEQNAILFACGTGLDLEGGTIYSLYRPCVLCSKMIVQVGIVRILYIYDYPDEFASEILKEHPILIEKFSGVRK